MPDSALVKGKAHCPRCGHHVLTDLRCQWGVLPLAAYALGDEVAWLRDASGAIVPPYVLVDVGPGARRWNCGDPRVENVILFDLDLYPNDAQVACPTCHTHVVALVAIVRQRVFQEIRALDDAGADRILGASRGKADIVIIRDDGSYWPREDWYDKAIEARPRPTSEGGTALGPVPDEEARRPIDRAIAAYRRGARPEETCSFCGGVIQVAGGPPGGPHTFVTFTCPCQRSSGFFRGL